MPNPRLIPVALLLAATAGCAPSSHLSTGPNGTDRLAPCPSAPHCVVSRPDAGSAAVAPLEGGADARSAHANLLTVLGRDPSYRILTDRGDYVHAVQVSTLLRFRDDVEFVIHPDGSIDVRSASRIGYWDMGANRRRVEALRSALADAAG